MTEYIYKIKKGKIYRKKVIRETKCYYYINREFDDIDNPFWFYTRWDKTVSVSEKEAIKEEINSAKTQIGMFTDRLESAKKRLKKAEELLMDLDT